MQHDVQCRFKVEIFSADIYRFIVFLQFAFIRGRSYDHNFMQFLPIFGENIGVFLNNQCFFQNYLALV
jgi:hypothetical protein